MPPNGVAKLHFGAHFQAPGLPNQTAGTVDVYGLQILDAEAGNTEEEDTAASALLQHEFLDGGADDVTGHPGRGAAGTHAHHARKFFGALQQPNPAVGGPTAARSCGCWATRARGSSWSGTAGRTSAS